MSPTVRAEVDDKVGTLALDDVYPGEDYAEGIAAFREKRPPDFS